MKEYSSVGGATNRQLKCPICRNNTHHREISFVNTKLVRPSFKTQLCTTCIFGGNVRGDIFPFQRLLSKIFLFTSPKSITGSSLVFLNCSISKIPWDSLSELPMRVSSLFYILMNKPGETTETVSLDPHYSSSALWGICCPTMTRRT